MKLKAPKLNFLLHDIRAADLEVYICCGTINTGLALKRAQHR